MEPTYIIAEIGQNHNGDLDIAKKLIDVASMPVYDFFSGELLAGVDAVKFTKRDLDEELTDEAGRRPYLSPHSFGDTYMEHRRALELSIEQHAELERYAHSKGLDFIETLCSPGSLKLLKKVKVDAVKVASRDLTNIPLLEAIGALKRKVIISTGMSGLEEIRTALRLLSAVKKEIVILHCVSQYPAAYNQLNLRSIPFLSREFPEHRVGYSDHSIGIVIPSVAVALGATVIEKHITLNRNMKGSDHAGAIEPDGLWRVVRDIRNTERSLGTEKKEASEMVKAARDRLARSLALQIPLSKGQELRPEYLCMRSPGTGLSWEQRALVLGKKAKVDIPANSLVSTEEFE
ncbi:MAG: N-acetylneuraminate synthase family protein [Candidatus Krumholzibacteriota bacterium]|nr:N-acetylneuraminate synthase family protein [Candidatus Krumholzibacteriota bacterium]